MCAPYLCLGLNEDGSFWLDKSFRQVEMVVRAYISSSIRGDRDGRNTHVQHTDRLYHNSQRRLRWPASRQGHRLDRDPSGNRPPLQREISLRATGWALAQIYSDYWPIATVAQRIFVQSLSLARLKIAIMSLESLFDARARVHTGPDTHRVFAISLYNKNRCYLQLMKCLMSFVGILIRCHPLANRFFASITFWLWQSHRMPHTMDSRLNNCR